MVALVAEVRVAFVMGHEIESRQKQAPVENVCQLAKGNIREAFVELNTIHNNETTKRTVISSFEGGLLYLGPAASFERQYLF